MKFQSLFNIFKFICQRIVLLRVISMPHIDFYAKIVCDAIVSTYQRNVNILIVSYCETPRWQSFILPACRQTKQKDLRFSKFKQRCNEIFHSIETEIPAIVGSRYGQRKRDEFISKGFVRCIKMNVIVNRIKYFLTVLHAYMLSSPYAHCSCL